MEIISTADLLRFVAALIFVVALMGGLALVMKRFGHGSHTLPQRLRRLKIVEILPVDSRHRLVLLRRDDREHLVMIGPSNDTLIETGIESLTDPKQEATNE